jgi:hypothetical protein
LPVAAALVPVERFAVVVLVLVGLFADAALVRVGLFADAALVRVGRFAADVAAGSRSLLGAALFDACRDPLEPGFAWSLATVNGASEDIAGPFSRLNQTDVGVRAA